MIYLTNIFAKRKQLGISLTKVYWLLGRKFKLSIGNKLLIYKETSSTKKYSNPSGRMAFTSGARPQIPTSQFWNV
jgi:hypothetical protein